MWKEIEKVKVIWSDWKEYERTPCEIYWRVMGFIRPVSAFNLWKKSEWYSRTAFSEDKVNNSQFLAKYLLSKPCCHVD